MQIKIYNIPIPDGAEMEREMNAFLRSKRILQTEGQLVSGPQGSYWSFCIRYLEDNQRTKKDDSGKRIKIDYKEVLDEKSFEAFSRMRVIRKELAQQEGVPAYAVFTDKELAALAKMENLTLSSMKQVDGIGKKKVV